MSNDNGPIDGSDETVCYVCGKAVGDHWFSRIKLGQNRICLCSAECSILYSVAPPPPADSEARKRFYREQDELLRAREADSGHVNSYDARLAHSAY